MAFTLGAAPAQAVNSGTQATTASTAFTAGRGLVALINWAHASATITSVIYDPGGANQTSLVAAGTAVVQGGNDRCHIYYLSNIPATKSTTIQVTWSATLAGAGFLNVKELIGGDTTTLLDNTGSGTGSSANPNCSVTTLTANCCIFATGSSAGSELTASGTGYVGIAISDPAWWAAGEYNLDVSAAAAKTVTMTATTGTWCIKAASFKLAGGAAVVTPTKPIIALQAVGHSFSW